MQIDIVFISIEMQLNNKFSLKIQKTTKSTFHRGKKKTTNKGENIYTLV